MENKEYEQSEVNLVTSAADLVVGIATGVSPIGTASSLVQFFINRKEQVHRKVFAAFLSANGTAEEVKAFLLKCDSDEEYSRNFSEWLLDILGELDDEDKGKIVGNLFMAFRANKLSRIEFLQLSDIVKKAFLPYLNLLAKRGMGPQGLLEYFTGLGLTFTYMDSSPGYERSQNATGISAQNLHLGLNKAAIQLRKFGYPDASEHSSWFNENVKF